MGHLRERGPTSAPDDDAGRRRWSRRAGMGLIVVGIALLGYVGWQLWGTNYVSQRAQDRIRDAVEEGWSSGQERVRVDGRGGPVSASAVVRIPRFGDDFAVPVVEGLSDTALASGLAHDPDTTGPGGPGNYVLAGHRITHGQPFRDLPDLEIGDELVVETRDAVYTYVLDTAGDALEVPLDASWVTAPLPVNPAGGVQPDAVDGDALITLVTCAELFHTDDRLVVFGHLASQRAR
ncbi:class E sortase [Nocardioides okcheonensis]|uniref:class E sortase n=1 Tax=Nocardioides okcheonensis TaxID=2894081 RepID=UPI001E40AF6F|nr:class E sortase [Nocardioides okcheonensis]UFN45144.1 class E sortase [Nocardioides okcheonensis]